MGIEEKLLPEGVLLTTVSKILGTARKNSVWRLDFCPSLTVCTGLR